MATETTVVDVVMPQMGVSVSEGTITKWLKGEGETIEADESLLEISTDKVDTEVPSPASGVLAQILAQEGDTVAVGTKIAVIAPEGAEPAADAEAPPEPATAAASAEVSEASDAPAQAPSSGTVDEITPAEAPEAETTTAAEEAPATEEEAQPTEAPAAETTTEDDEEAESKFVSPVVARIAAEHGVDVSRVRGTGRGGRVKKKDILRFIEAGAAAEPAAPPAPAAAEPAAPAEAAAPEPEEARAPERAEAPPAPAAAPEAPTPEPAPAPAAPQPEPVAAPQAQAAPSPAPEPQAAPAPAAEPQAAPAAAAERETVEPMSPMRKGIAEHMRRSLDTSAHVTTTFEVDLSKVVALRQRLKREYEEQHGVKLTYLAFIARATVDSIQKWPWMNAELRGESIVVKNYVNLGIAVALEGGKGLIVPVIKDAEDKNLLGTARAIADVAERARSKKLMPDDVQGGTFTITNPGGFGAIHGTPIISQPQVAILDVEALVKRPVVVEGPDGEDAIAIRPMMNLCLAYDHRLVDGAYAAQFMRDLKATLESWDEAQY